MGHQAVECKSSFRMGLNFPRRLHYLWIDVPVLTVATPKCSRLPHLHRLLSARGVRREGTRIIRMFSQQGMGLGHRNQRNLHRVVAMAMPSLDTGR